MFDFFESAGYQGGAGCWNTEDDYYCYAEGHSRRFPRYHWPSPRAYTKAEKAAYANRKAKERSESAFEDFPLENDIDETDNRF